MVDSRVANEGDSWAGSGAHPWHLDEETESILFQTNMSGKDARICFHVKAGGVIYYLTDLKLAAHETRPIDLRKLRDAQQPDYQGSLIPAGATDGSVIWVRLNNIPVMGRLLVMQHHKAMASNYDCVLNRCPAGLTSVTTATDMGAKLVGEFCQHQATAVFTDANGTPHPYSVTSDPATTWTASPLDIVQLNYGGVKGYLKCLIPGTTTVTAQYCDYTYTWSVAQQECVPHGKCLHSGTGHTNSEPKLTCGPSSGQQGAVTRGATVYCKLTDAPLGATISDWKFVEGSTTVSAGSGPGTTWSGTAVRSGTVSVKVSHGGVSRTPTAAVTVNARNWHTSPASSVQVPNGTFYALPVPPQPTGLDAGLGEFYELTSNPAFGYSTIGGGPNQGYTYFATPPLISTAFKYEINPDLENSNSIFSLHQYGACGFISWSNLVAQTRRHEYNSTIQSHYAFYKNSTNSASKNPGDLIELQTASPGANLAQFASDASAGLNTRYNQIFADASVEPFAVNRSEAGTLLGDINYAPYSSCP